MSRSLTDRTKTNRTVVCAVLLALASAVSIVCGFIPFLRLPFGGNFTLASALPVILIAYLYGWRRGLFCSLLYGVLQIFFDLFAGSSSAVLAFFIPSSDGYMGYKAVFILLSDYLIAYGVLFLGGLFRKTKFSPSVALLLGSLVALSTRYLVHTVSGRIFYGAWATWFFSQEGLAGIGEFLTSRVSQSALCWIYSVTYNGLYMIPEILVTAVAAVAVGRLPRIRPEQDLGEERSRQNAG